MPSGVASGVARVTPAANVRGQRGETELQLKVIPLTEPLPAGRVHSVRRRYLARPPPSVPMLPYLSLLVHTRHSLVHPSLLVLPARMN